MVRPIIFKCPHVGMNVQHQLPDEPQDDGGSYTQIACPARTRFHFINEITGKLLGVEEE
jgi:hypothetical protein